MCRRASGFGLRRGPDGARGRAQCLGLGCPARGGAGTRVLGHKRQRTLVPSLGGAVNPVRFVHPPIRPSPTRSKQRVFKAEPGSPLDKATGLPVGLPADFDSEADWYYSQIHTQVGWGSRVKKQLGVHWMCGRAVVPPPDARPGRAWRRSPQGRPAWALQVSPTVDVPCPPWRASARLQRCMCNEDCYTDLSPWSADYM